MSAQGLKHAEPTLDNKPGERKRGPAGRAAALRRAPSDSDCSGETASLSADSGERRPAPPPPRTTKARSRRRGSEWEVLEGLKDGQRFERRPEVFNGYLHKKRKWPLKGWHKRFFVVDGGILVYARSPTDVARGRLHGSLDVGLSVISAKPRRRRIDIDADEFIYHLRAKTPEVFRTWLNVLKAHRLYRQHLLTFGARESVPKIHAPLEELPPADTSSRISHSTRESFSSMTNTTISCSVRKLTGSPTFRLPSSVVAPSIYENPSKNTLKDWAPKNSSGLLPLEPIKIDNFNLKYNTPKTTGSLCSMCCIERKVQNDNDKPTSLIPIEQNENLPSLVQLPSPPQDSILMGECALNSPMNYDKTETKQQAKRPSGCLELFNKGSPFLAKPQTAMFFLAHRKRMSIDDQFAMKRSRKCTNVYKYRNCTQEPLLKRPLSRCMLLGKYKMQLDKTAVDAEKNARKGLVSDMKHQGDAPLLENKSMQDTVTSSECDQIAEKIMHTLFEGHKEKELFKKENTNIQCYVNEAVKELCAPKSEVDSPQCLFKTLLEFWLKNTDSDLFIYIFIYLLSTFHAAYSDKLNETLKQTRAVDRQSNKYFTKDAELSSDVVKSATKETQAFATSAEIFQIYGKYKQPVVCDKKCPRDEKCRSPPRPLHGKYSCVRERRIQELESLLKSTVYVCETIGSAKTKEKDIKITKTLIQNLDKFTDKPPKKTAVTRDGSDDNRDISDPSAEIPKIQETLNHLISDTDIPPEMAKEFLNAYLDVLLQSDSQTCTTTSTSQSSTTIMPKEIGDRMPSGDRIPTGDVQTECVQKKMSKSVTTTTPNNKPSFDGDDHTKNENVDPGQLYLKEVLDKITSIFSRVRKLDSKLPQDGKEVKQDETKEEHVTQNSSTNKCVNRGIVYENKQDKSVVIDLAKYDLENISMVNEATSTGKIAITIKLKEKPADFGEYKRKNLNLKFSKEHPQAMHLNKVVVKPQISFIDIKKPKTCIDPSFPKTKDLKACLSTSDATSKANRHTLHEADSFDLSQSSNVSPHVSRTSFNVTDNAQCYLLSSFKKNVPDTNTERRKIRLKELNSVLKAGVGLPELSRRHPDGATALEKPTPRIIDEKFILLLLENLTLLSKNLPAIHKDINNLYLKLRKRHERINKNASVSPGLSLLGKIYNSESISNLHRVTLDSETQYEDTVEKAEAKQVAQIAVNTSNLLSPSPKVLDISLSSFNIGTSLKHLEVQTETLYKNNQNNKDDCVKPKNGKEAQTSSLNIRSFDDKPKTDQCVSIQNWYKKLTQECSEKKVDVQKTLEPAKKSPKIVVSKKPQRKESQKVRQDLIKEISLLSPSSINLNVSTQAQTDRKNIRHWNCLHKNFKVFQLVPKNNGFLTRSRDSIAMDARELSDDLRTIYRCTSVPSFCSGLISPTAPPLRGPQAGFVAGTPGGRLASWIIESGGPLESASRELGQAQLSVQQLQRLLDALEHHDTDVSLEGASPNVKKDRRKFGLRKKKSNSKCASVDLAPPVVDASNSHMALSALTAPPSPGGGTVSMPNSATSLPIACAAARPQSLPGAEALGTGGPASLTSLTPDHQLREDFNVLAKDLVASLKTIVSTLETLEAEGPVSLTSRTPDHQLREDFNVLAKDLVASLKTIVSTLVCERGRLRAAMEAADTSPPGGVVASLRTNLTSALQQNSELRSRLCRIHDASDLAEVSSVGNNSDPQAARPFPQSLSYSSSCVSASEFFDAEEHDDFKPAEVIATDEETLQAGVIELDGDSSSEAGSLSSEEGSASSDNSDGATTPPASALPVSRPAGGRRERLPAPRPTPASPSLWNLLYKNIGKDLSQISMPVTINEPLNMLQRLCEELEYSELLDSAADCNEPVERMALIAGFAVSAYAASAHRAASKPFNPLLAETYECVRPDRDFRFIAEQVSHHPPISACHAESPRWTFWQEARIKTKFWGKSMEFQPTGRVHVRLTGSGDHYSWNKVTTCVHNLFGGQRWVDQYGDMHIVCHGTDITCKLNFIKASSWSSSRHEVRGSVLAGGAQRLRLVGRWSEGLQADNRPLWRPRPMPPDFELYYGFTRFAMELNELEPGMREILPSTDTRLRPDQRALEEGDVEAAEQFKHDLEQAQRERRRDQMENRPLWFRKTMVDGEETWIFPGEYWKAREAGFGDTPRLW